jgi:hypothetical protein
MCDLKRIIVALAAPLSLTCFLGPVALRPRLATGLPLQRYGTSVTAQSDKSSLNFSKFVTVSHDGTAQ